MSSLVLFTRLFCGHSHHFYNRYSLYVASFLYLLQCTHLWPYICHCHLNNPEEHLILGTWDSIDKQSSYLLKFLKVFCSYRFCCPLIWLSYLIMVAYQRYALFFSCLPKLETLLALPFRSGFLFLFLINSSLGRWNFSPWVCWDLTTTLQTSRTLCFSIGIFLWPFCIMLQQANIFYPLPLGLPWVVTHTPL